ncbi:MAG: mechanosensitive ion channel family protein [Spirochaetota bacterium]
MLELFNVDLTQMLTQETLMKIVRVGVVLAAGFILLKILNFSLGGVTRKRFSAQTAMLIKKAVFYTGAFIILVTVLRLLGLKLTALLGAAGIAGIALGFASQTSVSNIISGLFLISEKPFQVGDVITVGNTTGIIESIDLLSLKLRTFDNLYVRIPNEQLIKTEVTNITRFPIRRFNIELSVAYKEDLGRVREVLLEVAAKNPYCLDNPEPFIMIRGFGDSGINILLGAWFAKADSIALRNSILQEIKQRFDEEGIEIPFPHVSLYAGSVTAPMPVSLEQPPAGSSGEHGGGG